MSFPSYSLPENHGEADDLSTDFDADTIIPEPDEVPSLSLPPQRATTQQLNNNETTTTISDQSSSTNQSVPILRRINSRRPVVPSTTTTVTECNNRKQKHNFDHQSLSSSSKRPRRLQSSLPKQQQQKQKQQTDTAAILQSSTHNKSMKRQQRRSSRLQKQPGLSYVDIDLDSDLDLLESDVESDLSMQKETANDIVSATIDKDSHVSQPQKKQQSVQRNNYLINNNNNNNSDSDSDEDADLDIIVIKQKKTVKNDVISSPEIEQQQPDQIIDADNAGSESESNNIIDSILKKTANATVLAEEKCHSSHHRKRWSSRLRQQPGQSFVDIDSDIGSDIELDSDSDLSMQKETVNTSSTTNIDNIFSHSKARQKPPCQSCDANLDSDLDSDSIQQQTDTAATNTPQSSRWLLQQSRRSSRLQTQPGLSYVDVDSDIDLDLENDEAVINQSPSSQQNFTSSTSTDDVSSKNTTSSSQQPRRSARLHQHNQPDQSFTKVEDVLTTITSPVTDVSVNIHPSQRPRRSSSRRLQLVDQNYADVDSDIDLQFDDFEYDSEDDFDDDYSDFDENEELEDSDSTSNNEAVINQSSKSTATTNTAKKIISSIISSTTLQIDCDERWRMKFDALCAYKEEHGHVDVPCAHETLGNWVRYQRTTYKEQNSQNTKKSSSYSPSLNASKVQALESIGFKWVIRKVYQPQRQFYESDISSDDEEEDSSEDELEDVTTTTTNNKTVAPRRSSRLQKQQNNSESNEEEYSDTNTKSSSTNCKNTMSYHEANWQKNFRKLRKHKRLHGNFDKIYRSSKSSLYRWITKQRSQYKLYKKQNKKTSSTTTLTPERIQALNSIGFEWVVDRNQARFSGAFDYNWQQRFQDLCAYKEKYGHADVPQRYRELNLGEWVTALRKNYRKYKKNEKSSLNAKRVQQLESIGFRWRIVNRFDSPSVVSAYEERWQKKFQALCAYKAKHGHLNIPQKKNGLGEFVRHQRENYQLYKRNNGEGVSVHKINEKRIQQLESIGFIWRLQHEWDDYFADLCRYKDIHGHTNVAKKADDKDFPSLGRWVDTQRTQHKLLCENRASEMTGRTKITHERIQKLNSIDFEWTLSDA